MHRLFYLYSTFVKIQRNGVKLEGIPDVIMILFPFRSYDPI